VEDELELMRRRQEMYAQVVQSFDKTQRPPFNINCTFYYGPQAGRYRDRHQQHKLLPPPPQ
jgi:hypothetical protein